jgi:hypothetical protein
MLRLPHFLGNWLTDEVVSLTHQMAALHIHENSWYSFLLEAELPQGHSVAGRIPSIEKSHDIGN